MRAVASFSVLCAALAVGCGEGPGVPDAGPADTGPPDGGNPVVVLPDERAPCADRDPLRRPLFGDLHVHTSLSFDAAAYDVRTRPRDAYDFARGRAIGLAPYDAEGAPTRMLQLDRPLDFAAVTDHSEFLAETSICMDPTSPGYDSRTCRSWRAADVRNADYGELTSGLVLTPPRRVSLCRSDPTACTGALGDAWQEIQDAAEEAYDRTDTCSFTSLVGYEWTGTDYGDNLHRNVLFRTRSVPRWPTSFFEAWTPDRLWDALEHDCLDASEPCDVLAIPHNGNLAAGSMFVPVGEDGEAYTREEAARRARLEPLVEIYQHKGSSECVDRVGDPLASEDELCRFEEVHRVVCRAVPDDPPDCTPDCSGGGIGFLGGCVAASDSVRGALRTGLVEQARVGVNPFQLGVIGSTDTHQSLAGGTDERTFRGHLGDSDDEASELLDRDPGVLLRGLTVSAGGLAGVWAEENSRDAIFTALRRRETFATSGTRIVVRFFAGHGYPDDACSRTDLAALGYAGGVPMGGEITRGAGPLRFVVSALRDPMGAPLERLQIVVGQLEADGTTRERVIDVAGSELAGLPDPDTCAPPAGGQDQLCAIWEDPELDETRPAFWYARVLEVPTCRWSRHVCNEASVDCGTLAADDPLAACCDPDPASHVIRERAWTSPVWWIPE
ncbi:MAG: DUF3604 domain-containing protein [Myxococcota bacterium]|nr:DUF3604 domain-containing protein [Myxococcota bacterium]